MLVIVMIWGIDQISDNYEDIITQPPTNDKDENAVISLMTSPAFIHIS